MPHSSLGPTRVPCIDSMPLLWRLSTGRFLFLDSRASAMMSREEWRRAYQRSIPHRRRWLLLCARSILRFRAGWRFACGRIKRDRAKKECIQTDLSKALSKTWGFQPSWHRGDVNVQAQTATRRGWSPDRLFCRCRRSVDRFVTRDYIVPAPETYFPAPHAYSVIPRTSVPLSVAVPQH